MSEQDKRKLKKYAKKREVKKITPKIFFRYSM